MRLSVVVPVYNVERYLPHCLDALLNQGLQGAESALALEEGKGDYEIICVNDGSTDHSATILTIYQRLYPGTIRLITTENRGLAAARNLGLAFAQGDYVTFMDSDDYMVNGAYAYLLDHFCQPSVPGSLLGTSGFVPSTGSGVGQGGAGNVGMSEWNATGMSDAADDGRTLPDVVSFWRVSLTPYQLRHWNYSDSPEGEAYFDGDGVEAYNRHTPVFTTDKLIRREFLELNYLRFSHLRFCEDTDFNLHLFSRHPRVVNTTCNVYRYTKDNVTSLLNLKTPSVMEGRMADVMANIGLMNDFLKAGRTGMEPGIHDHLRNQVRVFHTRAMAARLSYPRWRAWMRQLRAAPYHRVSIDGIWTPVGWVMNLCAYSYTVYLLLGALYLQVFERHIRQKLP